MTIKIWSYDIDDEEMRKEFDNLADGDLQYGEHRWDTYMEVSVISFDRESRKIPFFVFGLIPDEQILAHLEKLEKENVPHIYVFVPTWERVVQCVTNAGYEVTPVE